MGESGAVATCRHHDRFFEKLSPGERSYYGADKDTQPNGFLVDAGMEKIEPLLPPPTPERLLAAGRAAVEYNYGLGITAWLDPLATDEVLTAYKLLSERGELISQVVALPQVFAKDAAAELARVQKTREAYKKVPNLHVTGSRSSPTAWWSIRRRPPISASLTKTRVATAICCLIRRNSRNCV